MIAFTPTDEQQMLIEAAHRYADHDLRKIAHEADEKSMIDAAIIQKGWELGILPGLIPEEYGGYAGEQNTITATLALEELAWGDLSIAMNLWTPSLFALPVLLFGTESQKQEFLPLFCDNTPPPMTAAHMEPGVLFDVWRPTTTAHRQGNKIILNGAKTYVPLANDAQSMLVYATDSETGRVDAYIVRRETDKYEVGERNLLMGIRALPTFQVNFSDVSLSPEARLGGDQGIEYGQIVSRSRIALGALAVGVARASFEYARNYAKERVQFGVPIATKQAVAFKIADMAIEVDAARLLVWEAAWQADTNHDLLAVATQLKQHISKMALFVADNGVQVLGGHGYIREHPVERWLRNARGFAAFEGLALI